SGREIGASHESISCHVDRLRLSAAESSHLALTLFGVRRAGIGIGPRSGGRANISRMPKSFPQDRTKVANTHKPCSAGSIWSPVTTPRAIRVRSRGKSCPICDESAMSLIIYHQRRWTPPFDPEDERE